MTVDQVTDQTSSQPKVRLVPPWLGLLVGVGSAVFGLLPWLVTGLRLPVQNLWATETAAEQMPLVLLPFSQYAITLIIGVVVTGAAAAGLCARTLRPRLPRRGVVAVAVGVLGVQIIALVQTAAVVRAGLAERRESTLYLAALVTVATLAVLVGALALGLVAAAPQGAAMVGMSIGALALGPWLSGLLVPFGTINPSPLALQILAVAAWVPAVLVGTVIAWGGLRTIGRVVASGVGLLLLWVVPALTTAIWNAAGSRVLARYPTEMAQYAVEVFVAALTSPVLALRPVLAALVVAAVGILGRRLVRAGRRQDGPSTG